MSIMCRCCRTVRPFLFHAFVAAVVLGPAKAVPVNLHLLVARGDGVAIETAVVPGAGELAVDRPDLITVVLPFGVGQSGDMVPRGRRPARLAARVQDGALRVTVTGADGSSRPLPAVAVADLAGLDLRINVTGSGGRQQAFAVVANGPAAEAAGPVIDMFRGQLPLGPGDWAITTEVTEHVRAAGLAGAVPLERRDGLLFARVTGSDGREGRFVVDTAAGATVVARAFLPGGAQVAPIEAVEHSDQGSRVVPGAMGGAGGDVASLLGAADLDALRLGAVGLEGVRANVVATLPDLGGAPVAGILGLDVLSRCGRLRLEYVDETRGMLTFDAAPADAGRQVTECAFTMVAKHLLVPARLDGLDVSLVLDTGARGSLIPTALAARAELPPAAGAAARTFRGLDGHPLPARPVAVNALTLGAAPQGKAVFFAADLPVLRAMGLDDNAGLLGGDLLAGCRSLELDFAAQKMRLVR